MNSRKTVFPLYLKDIEEQGFAVLSSVPHFSTGVPGAPLACCWKEVGQSPYEVVHSSCTPSRGWKGKLEIGTKAVFSGSLCIQAPPAYHWESGTGVPGPHFISGHPYTGLEGEGRAPERVEPSLILTQSECLEF